MARVVHFEIPVDDPDRAREFYRTALDWKVESSDERYWLATTGTPEDAGVDGALIDRSDVHASPVLIAGVESVDDTLQRAVDAGGQVLMGKRAIPGLGFSAYLRDSEGNVIGLFQPQEDGGMG